MDQGGSIKVYQELLLGISDHYLRNNVMNKFGTERVVGGILGKVRGKNTHLYKSFNSAWSESQGNQDLLVINEDALRTKLLLENQVNKDFALLGFYVTGPIDEVTDLVKKLYKVFRNLGDSIVIILYDPTKIEKNNKKQPQTIWEKSNEKDSFIQKECEICALHEEIIALESVMKSVQSNVQTGSRYVASMKTFDASLSNYYENLQNIRKLFKNPSMQDTELQRLIKEMVINYPDFVFESSKENLRDKFIMANLINLGSTIVSSKANKISF